MPTNREALQALAWVLVKDYVRDQARQNRSGHRRRRKVAMAINPSVTAAPPRDVPETTFVYVIGSAGHPIKIGLAKDVAVRVAQLQTGFPHKLRTYATFLVPTTLALKIERRSHDILSRERLSGEWFSATHEQASEAVMLAIHELIPRA